MRLSHVAFLQLLLVCEWLAAAKQPTRARPRAQGYKYQRVHVYLFLPEMELKLNKSDRVVLHQP